MHRSIVGAAIIATLGMLTTAGEAAAEPIPLEIGRDTTVLEGPLRDDGTVDYVGALNKKFSAGVTPENNAYAVIAQLIPPKTWPSEAYRRKQFELLGIKMPADDATYLSKGRWAVPGFDDRDHLAFGGQWDLARDNWYLWRPERIPNVIEYLAQHKEMLDRLVAGIQRERFWRPIVVADGDDGLALTHPNLSGVRHAFVILSVRARHRIHEGELDAAIEDILALKQLSRHMHTAPLLVEHLTGMASASYATQRIVELAGQEALTAEQARGLKEKLAAMEQRLSIERAFLFGDRMNLLDLVQRQFGMEDVLRDDPRLDHLFRYHFDRNHALRRVNAYTRDILAGLRAETPQQRWAQLEQLGDTVQQRVKHYDKPLFWTAITLSLLQQDQAQRSQTLADLMLNQLIARMVPSIDRNSDVVDQVQMYEQLERVALAVGGYRAVTGQYPQSLDDLVPEWMDAVPVDIYDPDGATIRYRVEGDRVTLYSVYRNGEDNGADLNARRVDLMVTWPPAEADKAE